MPKVVAFEWNAEQLRVIQARIAGRSASLEKLWTFNLPTPPEERDQPETPLSEKLAQQVGELLGSLKLPRCEALVVVSRAHVELRQLTLPPAPDEELPDMVRFQASREFTALEEDWPLDFCPLDADPSQPRNVLAAAMHPRLMARLQEVCQRHRLRLVRVGVRPFTAASVILRAGADIRSTPALLVGLFSDEADLSLILDGQVVLSRCARLHGDPLQDEQGVFDLVGQVRRTIAAAQGMLGARRVEKVVLCGAGQATLALAERLRGELRQEIVVFDPTLLPAIAGAIGQVGADTLGQFVPLVGILEEHAGQAPPTLDFVHPRRRPAPPSRRPYVVAGLVTAAIVLAGTFVYGYAQDVARREEIRQLQDRLKSLEARDRQLSQLEQKVNELSAWEGESVNWLDELYRLASKLPGSEELMLRQIKGTAVAGGGQIEIDGVARSLEAIQKAELDLQDDTHAVAGKSKNELASGKHYRYEFRSTIRVQRQAEKTAQTGASRTSPARTVRRTLLPPRGQP
ncbi:MAG: hypothetical protein NZ899_05210 [Thermoguttaceae bacterium]|nr:hypothetical protein [Thermoguttaceae bacterium]MDW8078285.1 hypothetical protein [Thermoguttaceae bacterium]